MKHESLCGVCYLPHSECLEPEQHAHIERVNRGHRARRKDAERAPYSREDREDDERGKRNRWHF